jgi:hypothetical protein
MQAAAEDAENLFSQFKNALVQIKSINIESGQKSSIGTGFFISEEGYLATNYHVISDAIQSPKQYRLEYVDHNDKAYAVIPIDIDVINDLAILKTDHSPERHFILGASAPKKGEELFALGNPLDLGMLMVPGTYNGLKAKSFYQRINFTGSLNPGMSGGPTVNKDGEVVGVNVSTAGNQLSFLVPVSKLAQLKSDASSIDIDDLNEDFFTARVLAQLTQNQQQLYAQIARYDWSSNTVGNISIPAEIAEFMPCWGDSNQDREKMQFTETTTNCRLNDNIFISSSFMTGSVNVNFNWIQSDKLLPMQLVSLLQSKMNNRFIQSSIGPEEVTNFHCQQAIIENAHNTVSKGTTCVRAYRKYEGLYDVRFSSVLLQAPDESLIASYSLVGVSEQVAGDFFEKFMESVKWN